MYELIKTSKNDNNEIIVSGRDLHEYLEVGTQYTKWFERMCEYGFTDNIDYVAISQKRLTGQGNETTYNDHAIKLDMAKEVSMIQRSDKGKQARLYFIEVEKKNNKPMSLEEIIVMQANALLENKRRVEELAATVAIQNNDITQIRDAVTMEVENFRKDTNAIVNKIVNSSGKSHQVVRNEIYSVLEIKGKCNLNTRLTNKRNRLKDEGKSDSTIKNVNKVDIINDNPILSEIYLGILKDYAIRYNVDLSDVER